MKLNFKRPQLWWQPQNSEKLTGRLRIFYPCGTSEWSINAPLTDTEFCIWGDAFKNKRHRCCFALSSNSLKETYEAMLKYDIQSGWPPAEFLGYL